MSGRGHKKWQQQQQQEQHQHWGNNNSNNNKNKPSSKLLLPTSWRLVFYCSRNQRHIVCLFGFYSSPLPLHPFFLSLSISLSVSMLWNWFSLPTNLLGNFIFHQLSRNIHVRMSFVVVLANYIIVFVFWGGGACWWLNRPQTVTLTVPRLTEVSCDLDWWRYEIWSPAGD